MFSVLKLHINIIYGGYPEACSLCPTWFGDLSPLPCAALAHSFRFPLLSKDFAVWMYHSALIWLMNIVGACGFCYENST